MPEYANPLPKFHFEVQWNNVTINFSEVSGLTLTQELMQYRHGRVKGQVFLRQAGLRKYSNITLKRGMFKSKNDFFEWWDTNSSNEQSATAKPFHTDRRNMTITLLDEKHQPVFTWNVINAWPLKIDYGNLKADSNEVAIETMEIVHEGFTVIPKTA